MHRLMKRCARGALGLGAAALLLAGVPAHAGPASCESARSPAGAAWDSQPLRLAQGKPQPEAAKKLEQQRLKEQQEREKLGQKQMSPGAKPQPQPMKKMDRMEESAPAPREAPLAAPPKPATSRFGAGVIRNKDSDGE